MAQQLIVEGKDAIVLANILQKRKMNPPKGYDNAQKFKTFVINAGGFSKVATALKLALKNPANKNIGIIVDCDQSGAADRFKQLINLVRKWKDVEISADVQLSDEGFSMQFSEDLTIGIWIMPDNRSFGYLEHFLEKLIDEKDEIWQFTKEKIAELLQQDFNKLTEIKKQKALIHTWLAWQKDPGHPMGLAVQANYFNAKSPNADAFVNWFENTFELAD